MTERTSKVGPGSCERGWAGASAVIMSSSSSLVGVAVRVHGCEGPRTMRVARLGKVRAPGPRSPPESSLRHGRCSPASRQAQGCRDGEPARERARSTCPSVGRRRVRLSSTFRAGAQFLNVASGARRQERPCPTSPPLRRSRAAPRRATRPSSSPPIIARSQGLFRKYRKLAEAGAGAAERRPLAEEICTLPHGARRDRGGDLLSGGARRRRRRRRPSTRPRSSTHRRRT